jgi:hypothetical protein
MATLYKFGIREQSYVSENQILITVSLSVCSLYIIINIVVYAANVVGKGIGLFTFGVFSHNHML